MTPPPIKLPLFRYKCGQCGNRFEAPGSNPWAYGQFVLHSATGDARCLDANTDRVFMEVDALIGDDQRASSLDASRRARLLHSVFGIACDPDARGNEFQVGAQPPCPLCGGNDASEWEAVEPVRYTDFEVPAVTHTQWSALGEEERRERIRLALDRSPLLDSPQQDANTHPQWTLVDGGTELISPRNWDELAAVIACLPEVTSVPNAICCLVAPGGDVLSIGIAGRGDKDNPSLSEPVASVSFEPGTGDPPYFAVVGDDSLDYETGGVAVFRYEDQWTEILRRNCVPLDIMTRITKDFFETGQLPDWIEWEVV